jgi:hypothetical protein
MKTILISSLLLISTLGYANSNSQIETTLNNYIESPTASVDSEAQARESNLIEHLLTGLDFSISNTVIADANLNSIHSNYYISLQLVVINVDGEAIKIELFKSDEFSAKSGYAELNKEFYIPGNNLFNTLDPYISFIETAQKINLAVSLIKSDSLLEKPIRNLGQNDMEFNSPNLIYTFNLDPNLKSNGYDQELNLPEAFSYAENSDITDIGFSIYYR